jgi:hypothetical protein
MLVDFSIMLWILIYLFVCACEFTYFSVLIKLLNNKAGTQWWVDGLPVGSLVPVKVNK